MKKYILIPLLLSSFLHLHSQQNVGIGTSSPHTTSILDVSSTTKGLLFPRMTYTERTSISGPAQGLLVYQTNSVGIVNPSGIYFFDGSLWKRIARADELGGGGGGSTGWTVVGDDQYSNLAGDVGIGTSSPTTKFHLVGNFLQENGTMTLNNAGSIIQFKNANVNKTYLQLSGNNLRMGTNSGNSGGQFIIRMNADEKFIIDSTGYVGIGTTSPDSKLHVYQGNIKIERPGINGITNTPYVPSLNFEISTENNKAGGLNFEQNGTSLAHAYFVHKTNVPSFFRFGISDPDALDLMIADNGRIGINVPSSTSDLLAQLHVRGDNNVDELALSNVLVGGSPTLQFYRTLGGGIDKSAYVQMTDENLRMGTNSGNSAGKFILRMNAVDRVTVLPLGNMGIGTSSPLARLHIEGGDDADPNPFNGNGNIMMGNASSSNMILDENEIMTRNGANSATLTLQNDGGDLKVGSNNKLLVANNGNVGIGTGSPNAKLHVNGSARLGYTTINAGGSGQVLQLDGTAPAVGFTYGSLYSFIQQAVTGLHIASGNSLPLQLDASQVAIGSINNNASNFKLTVAGKIICEELKVELYNSWPDYVFADNYELRPLYELKSFIETNHHLPNLPKAEEVAKEGFEVGEMNRILVEKVEELTLYIIKLQEQVDELKLLNARSQK